MTDYGYARVSSRDQDLTMQVEELTAAGCEKIFQEKVTGSKTDRVELRKLMAKLEPGDVLTITRLDRLARSTRDLLNLIDEVSKKGATFRSLKDTWADTTTAHGRLMVTILGGLAEFERELIRARTAEGTRRAKAMGIKLGRKHKLSPYQRREALERRDAGESCPAIAKTYGVDATTILRLKPLAEITP